MVCVTSTPYGYFVAHALAQVPQEATTPTEVALKGVSVQERGFEMYSCASFSLTEVPLKTCKHSRRQAWPFYQVSALRL